MSKVLLALISDDIVRDPFQGIFSLLRVYHTRRIEEFPVEGNFYIIVFWEQSGDEYVLESFELVDSVGNVIAAKPPIRVFFEKSMQITFTHFKEVPFQSVDTYTVKIYSDGHLAGHVNFALTD